MVENYTQTKLLIAIKLKIILMVKFITYFLVMMLIPMQGMKEKLMMHCKYRIEYVQYIENKIIDPFTIRKTLTQNPS